MTDRPAILFHFATRSDWAEAQSEGVYRASTLDREGFIHCATRSQVSGVIERHLRGRRDLVRLTLDATRLEPRLRYEWNAARQDEFPRLYGPIPIAAVIAVELFDPIDAEYGG